MKIKHFDQEVCTEVFLSELKPVLPNPEQVTDKSGRRKIPIAKSTHLGRKVERVSQRGTRRTRWSSPVGPSYGATHQDRQARSTYRGYAVQEEV